MAKKRRKVFRRQADRSWKELKPRKKRRKLAAKRPPKQSNEWPEWIRRDELHELLRPIVREAARAGLVQAIEHTSNFWNVSDGYKKYIDHQITSQTEALMAAVRAALREDRELRQNANRQKR